MSFSLPYDTHAFIKRLINAGMAEKIAEENVKIFTEIMECGLSTKQDILILQKDIKEMEFRFEAKLKELELRLILILGSLMAGSVTLTATLVKLF